MSYDWCDTCKTGDHKHKDWCGLLEATQADSETLERIEAKLDLLLEHFGLTDEEDEG